jgi:hypothetical protein
VAPLYDYDFHTAPARQYIILLDGAIAIETSLGEKREFKAGDVLLVEDVTVKVIKQEICIHSAEDQFSLHCRNDESLESNITSV